MTRLESYKWGKAHKYQGVVSEMEKLTAGLGPMAEGLDDYDIHVLYEEFCTYHYDVPWRQVSDELIEEFKDYLNRKV